MHNLNNFLSSINENSILNEGVKFGEKEVNNILSRSNDFNIGVEYEIRPNMDQMVDLQKDLEARGLLDFVDKVIPEHDSMQEVITEKMNLKDGLNHIKGMFKYLTEKDVEVPEMAGMHISVSTNKYNLEDFNAIKFYILLDSEYVHSIFPVRTYVESVAHRIKNSIDMVIRSMNEYDEDTFLKNITRGKIKALEDGIKKQVEEKYLTANIRDYNMSNGRVELRFFGGENYHTMYDDIKQQLLRALFILELGYTDLYQKEYYKELAKVIASNKDMIKDSKESIKKNQQQLLDGIRNEEPQTIYYVLNYKNVGFKPTQIPPKMFKKIVSIMVDKAEDDVLLFFSRLIEKDIPAIRERIMNSRDMEIVAMYAITVMNERVPEKEKEIIEDGDAAARYIHHFFSEERMPEELEKSMANNIENLFPWLRYINVLKRKNVLSDKEILELPSINMDALFKSLRVASESNLEQYVETGIVKPSNIDTILRTYVSSPGDNIAVADMTVLLREYRKKYDITNGATQDKDLRIRLLTKSQHFHNYLGQLDTDEKMAYISSLVDEYSVFMDDDKEKMAKRIGEVIEKREDKNTITDPLKPIDKEFIDAFNKKYNMDIK